MAASRTASPVREALITGCGMAPRGSKSNPRSPPLADAVTVSVAAFGAPVRQENSEVTTVHAAITVEVARTRIDHHDCRQEGRVGLVFENGVDLYDLDPEITPDPDRGRNRPGVGVHRAQLDVAPGEGRR